MNQVLEHWKEIYVAINAIIALIGAVTSKDNPVGQFCRRWSHDVLGKGAGQ